MEPEVNEAPYVPIRLDVFLMEQHPTIPRAQLQRFIKDGKVKIDDIVRTKNGYMVKEKSVVSVDFDFETPPDIEVIELPVLYEDSDCVVITKPLGVLTHSKGAFNAEGTVATWLATRPDYNFVNDDGNLRAGIVHRLDRATSGVMICAKNAEALRHLQKQFQDRKAKKTYIARVAGEMKPAEAIIDLPIERNPKQPQRFRVGQNGKHATTSYRVVKEIGSDSVLELKPTTGRTHQLRVHLEYTKHPIIGDTFYDGRPAERLFLHALDLEITLPNRERVTFTSPVPDVFYSKTV